VISADGIKTQRNPDKKVIQLFPDGRKTTVNPDGTRVEKAINGDVVTERPDKTKITVFKVPFGDNQVTKKTEHPDGTVIESHKTGLKTAIFPDGTIVETHTDSKITKMVDKTVVTDYLPAKEDGLKKVTKFADGVVVQTYTDGHDLQTDTDGTTILTKAGGVRIQTFKDGATLTTNLDGTKVQLFEGEGQDGMKITIFTDGKKVQENADGVIVETRPNGDKITKHPDGDIIEHYKEPKTFVEYSFKADRLFVMKECKPSGIIVVTDVDGEMEVVPLEDQKKAVADAAE